MSRWSRSNRNGLLGVIRAKGGVRETSFVALFNAHARLRAAIVDLSHDSRAVPRLR